MSRDIALLRGINVGGKNVIPMAELKACFEAEGFSDVTTYIQSGNVIFTSVERGRLRLTRRIEDALAARFAYRASVVVRSRAQLRRVVDRAPAGFGTAPAKFRYDVIFLKEPLAASRAMRHVLIRPGVDQADAGVGVLYFSRLISNRMTELGRPESFVISR